MDASRLCIQLSPSLPLPLPPPLLLLLLLLLLPPAAG